MRLRGHVATLDTLASCQTTPSPYSSLTTEYGENCKVEEMRLPDPGRDALNSSTRDA